MITSLINDERERRNQEKRKFLARMSLGDYIKVPNNGQRQFLSSVEWNNETGNLQVIIFDHANQTYHRYNATEVRPA
jgi:hypothetical protein